MSPSPYHRYQTLRSTSTSSQQGTDFFDDSTPMTPTSLIPVTCDDQPAPDVNDMDGSFEGTAQDFDTSTAHFQTYSSRTSRIDPQLENQAVIDYPQNVPEAGLQEHVSSYHYQALNPEHIAISDMRDAAIRQEHQGERTESDHHLSVGSNRKNLTHLDAEPTCNCKSLGDPNIVSGNYVTPIAGRTVAVPKNPSKSPVLCRSVYSSYSAIFADGAAAKAHRKSARKGPRPKDSHFDTVKTTHRGYWVQKLHESMIDISNVQDGSGGDGYKRFVSSTKAFYENRDLEAAAHEVFDAVIDLYERGFTLPLRYDLTPKYGDDNLKTVTDRLQCICAALKDWKAICVDVMDGGWKVRKMVNHPPGYVKTKEGNKHSNGKRKETIQAGQEVLAATRTRALTVENQTKGSATNSFQELTSTEKKGKAKSKPTRSKKIPKTVLQSAATRTTQSPSINHAGFQVDPNQQRNQFPVDLSYGGLHTSGDTARHLHQPLPIPAPVIQQDYTQITYQDPTMSYDHFLGQQFEAPRLPISHQTYGTPTTLQTHLGYTHMGISLNSQRQYELPEEHMVHTENFSSRVPFSPALSTISDNIPPTIYPETSPVSLGQYHYGAHDSTISAITNNPGGFQSSKKRGRGKNDDIPQATGSAKRIRQM
ncbi:hypothetical protein AOQ84DRAFT_221490 [Glonium stellatum]|uniref:Uncharacterized protein n=1 Tax=Glonium stellatum TaxID=574774 RepID=A0A8E2FCE5_9PEZI|nr:hypothetical protein AOQ84DRAFT_221490 [Glonium stellatum]